MKKKAIFLLSVACVLLTACAPKVGSPEWCEKMDAKPKGDWSLNEAKDYTKHCVFK
jgi:outer membrane biogenesis lipoprotein LolB